MADMRHFDVADMCWLQPGCEAFSIFLSKRDGQYTYCLKGAAEPLTGELPAEWDMANYCSGVYTISSKQGSC